MLEKNLPSWRQDLKTFRKKEGKSPSNRWVQLATVNDKNEPDMSESIFSCRNLNKLSLPYFFLT